MSHRNLEERLMRMRRVPAPESLHRRMETLFDETGEDLELRLKRMEWVAAPTSLDRRMEALFDKAGQDGATRRPWRLPVWAAAAAGLLLVATLLIRRGVEPEPLVVEITLDTRLEQFLLGNEPAVMTGGLEILTRGDCAVETVWPADAPGLDRRPTNGSFTKGDRK